LNTETSGKSYLTINLEMIKAVVENKFNFSSNGRMSPDIEQAERAVKVTLPDNQVNNSVVAVWWSGHSSSTSG